MKIICMLAVFNNAGFIEEAIDHYLSQGLELVIFDDGSTDGTYEICKKYSNRNEVELLQVKHSKWEHTTIFKILYDMALLKSPDWVIRPDSDEILESGMNGITLKDAIIKVDSEGYNTIQFDWFEFFLTDNDDDPNLKVKDRMKYYSWQYDFLYRAWKVIPGITAELGWGHLPVFPKHLKYKIYPRKFVARHYRFISVEQAGQKINTVLSRTENTINEKSVESEHYQMIADKKNSFIIDHSLLTKYNDDDKWNLERKFYPYIRTIPPTREEVFNQDGTLKMKILDIPELRIKSIKVDKLWKELQSQREQNEILKKKNLELEEK